MAIFSWIKGEVPKGVEIRQIYGICFTNDGRILLRIENGKYQLTGGKPDSNDVDFFETLKREYIEEANTIIEEPTMVGYQLVDEENGSKPYAQIRLTALVKTINEPLPDPDREGNWVYGRLLTTPKKAGEMLGWGQIGIDQVNDSWAVAKEKYHIIEINEEETIINMESRGVIKK